MQNGVNLEEIKRTYLQIVETHGVDSQEALNCQVKLALAYDKAGKRKEARSLMDQIYDRKCELFGEMSPSAVRTFCARLLLYNVENNEDSYVDMLNKAEEKLEQIKETDDNDVLNALYNYASALARFYDHSPAGVYEDILRWVEKFRGEGSGDHLHILSELSDVYYELEFYEEAIEVGNRLYSYLQAQYGDEDENTLAAYENLAKVYYFDEKYNEALHRLDRLVGIYIRSEKDAKKIVETYYNMAVCYGQKKDNESAIEKLQVAYDLCNRTDGINADLVNEVRSLLSALKNGGGHMFLVRRWNDLWGIMR